MIFQPMIQHSDKDEESFVSFFRFRMIRVFSLRLAGTPWVGVLI